MELPKVSRVSSGAVEIDAPPPNDFQRRRMLKCPGFWFCVGGVFRALADPAGSLTAKGAWQ